MPYRGEQAHAEESGDDGTNRLLAVLGASALLYPIARTLIEVITWRLHFELKTPAPTVMGLFRVVSYAVFSLHALPAVAALLLARKATVRDTRLLYGIGGAAMLVGLGIEFVPTESIAAFRWVRVIATLLVNAALASIAHGVARTRRASEDNDAGIFLSSVVALAAGSILEVGWWVVDGYMHHTGYGWTSYYSDHGVDALMSKLIMVFFVAPLFLLGAGALVRARARKSAPVSDERGKEPIDEADDLVRRLRGARNVLVAFALGAFATALPTLVLLAGMVAREGGPIGVRQIARPIVIFEGVFTASLAMAFVASGGPLKDDERGMRRGVLLGLLAQLVAIGILLGDVKDLDTDIACGFWSFVAAGSIFAHAELARGILLRALALSPSSVPEGIAPFTEELRRLVRWVAIGVSISIGALFFADHAKEAPTITTLSVLGSFATISSCAGALVAAARARRVLDRAILWRLAGAR